jgi:hypothetical protein
MSHELSFCLDHLLGSWLQLISRRSAIARVTSTESQAATKQLATSTTRDVFTDTDFDRAFAEWQEFGPQRRIPVEQRWSVLFPGASSDDVDDARRRLC